MSEINLHIHSKHSHDADLFVTKIIDICKEKEIKIISITGYNTVKAVK